MNKYPDESVPADMPKDLGRVYAALNAPVEPAPEALLQRILTSRAAGHRAILPVGRTAASRFRTRLLRGAIAAALGLLALATWSRLSRSTPDAPAPTNAAAFRVPMPDDFGFATPAEAQGNRVPKFEPMTFDVTRLHPVRLRYVRRAFTNGKATDSDTLFHSLTRSSGPDAAWVLVTERRWTDMYKVSVVAYDTVWLDLATLHTAKVVLASRLSTGGSSDYRWEIGARSATLHAERRNVWYRPVPGGKAFDRIETTITDTFLPLPESRYPRATNPVGTPMEVMTMLMAAPIGPGWKRSFVIAVPGGREAVPGSGVAAAIPMDFEVVGDEHVDSPSGKVDCWKLRRRGAAQYTYFIRKSDGVLIKVRTEGKLKGKRFLREIVLIGEP